VALTVLADDPELEVGFIVRTRNRWAVGVAKHRPELRERLDAVINTPPFAELITL
jgi:polar amino acid transport system substrate-binding protein